MFVYGGFVVSMVAFSLGPASGQGLVFKLRCMFLDIFFFYFLFFCPHLLTIFNPKCRCRYLSNQISDSHSVSSWWPIWVRLSLRTTFSDLTDVVLAADDDKHFKLRCMFLDSFLFVCFCPHLMTIFKPKSRCRYLSNQILDSHSVSS